VSKQQENRVNQINTKAIVKVASKTNHLTYASTGRPYVIFLADI
jgi:hypothetical protein